MTATQAHRLAVMPIGDLLRGLVMLLVAVLLNREAGQ